MDQLLPWLRRSGWAYLVAALVLAAVAWRMGPGGGAAESQPAPGPSRPAVAVRDAPAPRVLVHVAGAVRRPGVYRLPKGARAIQALERAGGPVPRADLAGLNLAAPVQDGQQLLVPARAPAAGTGAAAPATAPAGGPISLSSATPAQLEELDGIGPALAQRIVDWRTQHGGFGSVEELLEVPGIGPARLEAMRGRLQP